MQEYEEICREMNAVMSRFKVAVIPMVERHRSAGDVLTWRLIHELECEGVEAIKRSADLDPEVIRMLVASPLMGFPRLKDEPVDFGQANIIPSMYSVILKEYQRTQ